MATPGALAARVVVDTAPFKAGMTEIANFSEKEMKRAASATKFVNDYLRETAKLQHEAGTSSAGIKEASKHMEEFGFKTAGAKRELLVLGHELSQGNYSRFGGSLLVLGERTGAASLLFSGMGLAVIGVTAAVGAFVTAAVKGAMEQDHFNKSLIATGNYAGVTADSLSALAEQSAHVTKSSKTAAAEAAQALVSTGRFGPSVIAEATQATLLMEKVTGQSAEEIAKDFEKMGDGVAKWAAKHNQSMHYLTLEQFKYIKQLEDQGKAEQAEAENFRIMAIRHQAVIENLGYMAQAWKTVGLVASDAWEMMKGFGKDNTAGENVDKARQRLQQLLDYQRDGSAAGPADVSKVKAAIDAQRLLVGVLQDVYDKKQRIAHQTAEQASKDDKAIQAIANAKAPKAEKTEWVSAFSTGPQQYKSDFMKSEIASYDEIAKAELRAAEAAKKLADEQGKLMDNWSIDLQKYNDESAMIAGTAKKLADYDRWGAEMKARLAKETRLLTDAQQQAVLVALDAEVAYRKEAEQIEKAAAAEAEFQKWFASFQQKEGPGLSGGDTIAKYLHDIGNESKAAERMVAGSFSRMEDALVNFVKTGKLNFKDLWSFMAEEFIREQIRIAEKKLFLDKADNFSLAGIGSIFSSVAGLFTGNSHANGLDYVPYDGYPAILHQGERVQTAVEARSGGGGQVVRFDFSGQTTNVGQGVSRGEVAAAVNQGNAQTEQRIRRLMRQGAIAT